jgi:signal transduction histidine kinase/CheY-like chemotaxis protein
MRFTIKLKYLILKNGYSIGLIALLFIAGVAYQNAQNYFALTDWVLSANEVLHQIREIDNSLDLAEIAVNKGSLSEFKAQCEQQDIEINKLAKLTISTAAQPQFSKMRQIFSLAFDTNSQTLPSESLLQSLHPQLRKLENIERKVLVARIDVARNAATLTFKVIGYAAGLALLVLVLARLQIIYDVREISEKQRQLESARQTAEAASRSKSEFLANMSHEIRTPMNAVIGMASLLLRSNPRPDQMEYCETIQRSGQALLRIIQDVLDLSRVEAGKLSLEAIRFDPRLLLHHVADMISPSLHSGVRIEVDFEENLPEALFGDAGRIQQVLLNIAGNAAKFTDNGEIHLHASVSELENETALIRFEVSDTGIGIPKHAIEKLFQPFSQVSPGATREKLGTGLGLSICKRLVEAMGGTITLESTESKGSKFSFDIPLSLNTTNQPQIDLFESYDNDPLQFSGRVLVVDDNHANLIVASRLLEAMGLKVDSADNAIDAVTKALSEPYHIIFMDCQMPEIDGFVATQRIRQGEVDAGQLTRTPIIALTAHASRTMAQRCFDSGMDDFIHKPIDFDQLNVTVGRFMTPIAQGEDLELNIASELKNTEFTTTEAFGPVNFSMLTRLLELPMAKNSTPQAADLVTELINLFEQGRFRANSTLQNHFANNDVLGFGEAAHFFKSSASSVGAMRLMNHLAKLEQCRENGILPADAIEQIAQLDLIWSEAVTLIREWWASKQNVDSPTLDAQEKIS